MTLLAFKTANKLNNDPFNETTIRNIVKKIEETYSLHDKPRSGRPSLSEDRESTRRLQEMNPLGHCSSTQVAEVTGSPGFLFG